jgi:hypothetical protein
MPDLPELPEWDWDLDDPGSRFTRAPAIAIGMKEGDWPPAEWDHAAIDAIRDKIGDWILEEQPELGRPEPVPGSRGRGAAGLAAVIEWVALNAAGGVIPVAAGMAFRQVVRRANEAVRGRRPGVEISRGGAAYVAVAEVAERFREEEGLEVEAVEEPSSIAGREVSELSYVGIEPWVVLLRNQKAKRRYVVVVAPDGENLGALQTPMGDFEEMFLPGPERTEWARTPRSRRYWWRSGGTRRAGERD